MKNKAYEKLMQNIQYNFKNIEYLKTALTHRSIRNNNNERLEFLGDSILNFIAAEAVYQNFPERREGELTRLRAQLVKGETLARWAHQIELFKFIRLGDSELKSGGNKRDSILSDAVEALIAAIYLDSNFETAQNWVNHYLESELQNIDPQQTFKDPKTRLQEFAQGQHYPLPQYQLIEVTGKAHEQTFIITCQIQGLKLIGKGKQKTRRKAEQQAAEHLLKLLGIIS